MPHICDLPKPDLNNPVDRQRSFSAVYLRADELMTKHTLPQDQPCWTWAVNQNTQVGFGSPGSIVLPVDFCPFCGVNLHRPTVTVNMTLKEDSETGELSTVY